VLRAVIFDFDGVLVNSEPLHFRALRDSLRAEGIEITEAEYAAAFLAYTDQEAARLALEQRQGKAERARVLAVAERKARLFEALMREVPFFPGARDLVLGLGAAGVPLAIASGALRSEIERILEAAGLRDRFAPVVGADDVGRGKPHPEPYLRALAGLRRRDAVLEAGQCLVLEDTPAGIAAGRAAGMRVAGVAQTYPAEKLAGAHHVLPALAGVTPAALAALFA
jgi:HAD superfamily hydrolase (TIGR01509 family)